MPELSKQGINLTDLLDAERKKETLFRFEGEVLRHRRARIAWSLGQLVLNPKEKWWTDLLVRH
jgi:hypothetical protein